MHTDTAPIPASSGATHRHRLNRGGNRRLNAAVHRIAITRARVDDRARLPGQPQGDGHLPHGGDPRSQTPPRPTRLQTPGHRQATVR
ncbi:transposase [Micromonospora sp. NPDC003776]